jgi:hypothetical protein
MEKRTIKRMIIILIYLFLLLFVAYTFYKAFKPKESCFDKIKNQNEEDVDCGGVCAKCKKITAQDLVVQDRGFVENGSQGKYDFWALISNPNSSFGAKSFRYEIKFKDANGSVIASRSGSEFILPGEKKYVVENSLESSVAPSSTEFAISKTEWAEFNNYYEKPNLNIVNKNYNQINSGVGFSEASGLLKNDSPYDFNVIKIQIMLKNYNGKIVALNSTEMRTVKSGEDRDFKVLWPNRFPGDVAGVDAQTEVNIFESEAFIRNMTVLNGNESVK